MATSSSSYGYGNGLMQSSSSQRGVAMVLAVVSAVVLSPLYVDRRKDQRFGGRYEAKWSSGFVLPVVLAGLIVAIKTTSSTASSSHRQSVRMGPYSEPSMSVMKIGSSSWGLAAILVMLMFVMSWQSSVQHFLWR